MTCVDVKGMFFNDLQEKDAEYWLSTLQPGPAEWNGQTITYCGWREVPSKYIICEKDGCLPAALQEQLATVAGSDPIVRIPAGHMARLSKPERVAEIVNDVAIGRI